MPSSSPLARRACFILFNFLAAAAAFAASSVDATIDAIVSRLYAANTPEALQQLDEAKLQSVITPEERGVLATQYWHFETDMPITVSIIRDTKQALLPFWLPESGFTKTDLTLRNEESQFEVWQKTFPAGHVGLGINGFDGHRFCYYVVVTPQTPGQTPSLTGFIPANQTTTVCNLGATTYVDWTELVLTEVPESLRGGILLQTHRGRARESHLLGAFRQTPYPSSEKPDQIVLTWKADPASTQSVAWRTNTKVAAGAVRYKDQSVTDGKYAEVPASLEVLKDRMLANDPAVNKFSATLEGLKPSTTYEYLVGDPKSDVWSDAASFTTAPAQADTFSFALLSDTHNKDVAGKMLANAYARTPRPALAVVAGDLVDTGIFQDDWDKFFAFMGDPLRRMPLLPAVGNHDDQGGYGLPTYAGQFVLGDAKMEGIPAEACYSVRYANALFIVLSVGVSVEAQTRYLERELSGTDAAWKIVTYHFPPYAPRQEYEAQQRQWGALFDKYHVDFMLGGHTHRYYRSKPIRDGKEVESPAEGTVYIVAAPRLYQTFDFQGKKCVYQSWNADNELKDSFTIEKP